MGEGNAKQTGQLPREDWGRELENDKFNDEENHMWKGLEHEGVSENLGSEGGAGHGRSKHYCLCSSFSSSFFLVFSSDVFSVLAVIFLVYPSIFSFGTCKELSFIPFAEYYPEFSFCQFNIFNAI